MTLNVGFFGGSFDPPHVAHVLAVSYALSIGGFDKILVAPTYQHPFAKSLTSFEHRVKMCELAMERLSGVEVTRIEQDLHREGEPSYTVRTLEALAARHPDWRFRLVIGSDLVAETSRWHDYDRLASLAPPFVIGRSGYSLEGADEPDLVLPKIASTEIRRRVRSGDSLTAWVPLSVRRYIAEMNLYLPVSGS